MFAITKASASFRNAVFCSVVAKQRSKCERMLGFGLHFFEGGKTASAELELEAGVVGGFITGLGLGLGCSTDDDDDDGWSLVVYPLCSQVQYLHR